MNFFKNVLLNKSTQFIKNMSFYAVAKGHEVGIFESWDKCEKLVKGFKGAKYKKFKTKPEAENFIRAHGGDLAKCGKAAGEYIPLGKKNLSIKINDIAEKEDFWPECDGDNFEVGDQDLVRIDIKGTVRLYCYLSRIPKKVLALLQAEQGTSKTQTKKGNKRKCPNTNEESSPAYKFPKHESKIWEPIGIERIGAHVYQIDSEGFVICYTDGSCFNNGRKNASAGYGVYFDDDHPLNAAKPVKGRVTNNAGEIQAAIHAIKTAKSQGIEKLCLSTDSQFLINAVTLWMNAWKQKGWRLKNGDPVKNIDDFKELDSLIKNNDVTIKWNYVKGHKGIKGNEMADQLARQGTEIFKKMHKIDQ